MQDGRAVTFCVRRCCFACRRRHRRRLGNSFFYYNNSMHMHVINLVHAADPKSRARATSVTISGSGIDWHDMASYFRPRAIGRYTFGENAQRRAPPGRTWSSINGTSGIPRSSGPIWRRVPRTQPSTGSRRSAMPTLRESTPRLPAFCKPRLRKRFASTSGSDARAGL